MKVAAEADYCRHHVRRRHRIESESPGNWLAACVDLHRRRLSSRIQVLLGSALQATTVSKRDKISFLLLLLLPFSNFPIDFSSRGEETFAPKPFEQIFASSRATLLEETRRQTRPRAHENEGCRHLPERRLQKTARMRALNKRDRPNRQANKQRKPMRKLIGLAE